MHDYMNNRLNILTLGGIFPKASCNNYNLENYRLHKIQFLLKLPHMKMISLSGIEADAHRDCFISQA